MLRSLRMNLSGDIVVVLIVHKILLVHSVQELHHCARTRADLTSLLHLHCEYGVRDDLLRHGVAHGRGCNWLRLGSCLLGRGTKLLHSNYVLPADKAVERYYRKVDIIRVIVLEDSIALDLAGGQVTNQTQHPELSELAQQISANLLCHDLWQVEDGELRRWSATSSPASVCPADELRHGRGVEADLHRWILTICWLFEGLRSLDDDLVALVLDSVELHSDVSTIRRSELQLGGFPFAPATATVFLCHHACKDGSHVAISSLVNGILGHSQNGSVEELDELLPCAAQGEVLEDHCAGHHLLVGESGHVFVVTSASTDTTS
mmetsp:Transcript_773/g.1431  ORF Transcript_773/g.1431 Transcript_773/m.1431 type:complete len:320 (+) Transcript_773:279-1238(+)